MDMIVLCACSMLVKVTPEISTTPTSVQRVFSVLYTIDNRGILSGSDDGNVRLWKACALEMMGVKDYRRSASRMGGETQGEVLECARDPEDQPPS